MADVFTTPAILLIGNDPTEQHPLLAWQIRNNVRLHRAKLHVINSQPIKLRRQAASFTQIPAGAEEMCIRDRFFALARLALHVVDGIAMLDIGIEAENHKGFCGRAIG